LLIERILCLGRLARLASKKDARHLFQGGDSSTLHKQFLTSIIDGIVASGNNDSKIPVRNRLRNYHMTVWIDAQPEAYIYVSEKRDNP
jgi:hypothetical protein